MKIHIVIILSLIFLVVETGFALEPNEILVVANGDVAASIRTAEYYCAKRKVPVNNILTLELGAGLSEAITRSDYDKYLAGPIRRKLAESEPEDKIKCLLMTYGVPVKVDHITGEETGAGVDSELSMVLFDDYELYRWQPNALRDKVLFRDFKADLTEKKTGPQSRTLMVCRLDGPGEDIATGLVDKAMLAEKNALTGVAYIDSGYSAAKSKKTVYYDCDRSLQDLALVARFRTELSIVEERSEELFAPGECPSAALYCGWYSLGKYVDAFDFVDGAIGYHIASLEAVDLRDPNSSQWCPAMLKDGVTATLGVVAEPYLRSFPKPKEFFIELFNGRCLVEAYYHTKPFNSWQLVLIGDPLYRPFRKR